MNKNDYNTAEQIKTKRLLDFYKNYEKFVSPYIEEYEKERIKELCKLTILPTIIILALAVYQLNILLLIIIYGGLFIFWNFRNKYLSVNKNFQNLVKKDLLPKILKNIEGISWCSAKNIISNEIIRKSKLFTNYNTKINDDEFEGEYKGVRFKVAETRLKNENNEECSAHVFKGIIILVDSNKEIKAYTKIQQKMDKKLEIIIVLFFILFLSCLLYFAIISESYIISFNVLALCFYCFWLLYSSKQNNIMTLEDSEFDKKFIVTSEDQVEGRYLITPAFIERFKNLQTAFKTKNIECAFFDDKIMFALHTNKDFFELSGGLFHSLKDPKQIKSFYNEITAIYDIIDYFKLAEKTGL